MRRRHVQRKTAPKVRDGTVQRKSRWDPPRGYWYAPQPEPVFGRKRPGAGYVHLVRLEPLQAFVEALPMWGTLKKGLDAIVLDAGDADVHGWCNHGVIGLCAWPREFGGEIYDDAFVAEHRALLDKLRIPQTRQDDGWHLGFDRDTARAFQLVHVLIHELGHHHDLMTSRHQRDYGRGEPFAEAYAVQHEDEVLDLYCTMFDL